MADEETPAEETPPVEKRIDSLESRVDEILGILKGGHGEQPEAEQPEGGTNIAHEIRQQLDERDRKNAADAAEREKGDRLAAAEAKLAELSEKPPEPMPRRIERIMGWR